MAISKAYIDTWHYPYNSYNETLSHLDFLAEEHHFSEEYENTGPLLLNPNEPVNVEVVQHSPTPLSQRPYVVTKPQPSLAITKKKVAQRIQDEKCIVCHNIVKDNCRYLCAAHKEKWLNYDSNGLGERLKKLRDERHYSQDDIAYSTGLHQTTISRVETGSRRATIVILAKIAESLHLPLSYFFKDEVSAQR